MKALILEQPGTPDTLRLAEMPQPQPGEGEVRIQVNAVGLNPADYKFMETGFPQWKYPFIPGMDVAGTIDALGKNVTNWSIGDRVYYHGNFTQPGGFAEFSITTAHTIAPIPDHVAFTTAAALPCASFTAYQVLYHKLHIQPGQSILIHGGAGGVGGFAIQLAAREGVEIISTCSTSNIEWVQELGATNVIDYTKEDVTTRVMEITQGRGIDAIIDTVSSASATTGLELLAYGGSIACVAGLPDFRKMQSFGKAISVHDIALGMAYLLGDKKAQQQMAEIGQAIGKLIANQQINPILTEIISLAEIPHALVRLSHRHVRGKIVAQIDF
ncbi:MAG: zinc-binding dehydrogenase [Sphaerospermopsis sp. SIO1G2]|nr:zinc-binding dehydrogenase [Sphaerospermopsis sp. SIO1G1]NET72475.1 zinc-binding dehydrogenase [Sphaerospermopsis sp. SIO1G2]